MAELYSTGCADSLPLLPSSLPHPGVTLTSTTLPNKLCTLIILKIRRLQALDIRDVPTDFM